MADKIKFGRFVHSDTGVIAVTKGAGVRAWVAAETARLAAKANAEAASHHVPSGYRRSLEKKYPGTFDSAPTWASSSRVPVTPSASFAPRPRPAHSTRTATTPSTTCSKEGTCRDST